MSGKVGRLGRAAMSAVLASLLAISGAGAATAESGSGFMLHDHDTVLFYGDSITEQNRYTQWVELYAVTRFPNWRLHFVTSGVGGDKVSGGGGGPIDVRLARDVIAYRPDVVTIMLGMNDGQYQAPNAAITAAYVDGYTHILSSLKTALPQARITLIGPSAFDDVTRPPSFAGGYNGVMTRFAALDAKLAADHGAASVDLNAPVVAALTRAQAIDPAGARQLLPDRVHPETVIHWVMAEALLKGWHAPAAVSSLDLDGARGKVLAASNLKVDALRVADGALDWTSIEGALPLPIDADNEIFATLLKIDDVQSSLNREMLRVGGLPAARYALSIDGKPVADLTGAQLAAGVNLATLHTPMRDQAQRVSWLVRDRTEAHYIRLRAQVNGLPLPDGNVLDALDTKLQDDIYRAAAPVPHQFRLQPA